MHIRFCLEVYAIQIRAGRHFAHEHPSGSTAWSMPEVKQFILEHGVECAKTNMCSFGMVARDELGSGLVAKPTTIMSSSPEILKRICRPCRGSHRHVHLISGRAHAAQVYPRQFCAALCEGIAAQKRLDELGLVARPLLSMEEMSSVTKGLDGSEPSRALHEECSEGLEAYDDLSGDRLEPALMQRARREEN